MMASSVWRVRFSSSPPIYAVKVVSRNRHWAEKGPNEIAAPFIGQACTKVAMDVRNICVVGSIPILSTNLSRQIRRFDYIYRYELV